MKDIEEDEPRGILKVRKIERPDPDRISTSMVARANLAMRTRMRRFPRQTMGFSRKAITHAHAVDLNFMVSNFVLPHGTLTGRYGRPTTPAMAAGLESRAWSMLDVTERMDITHLNAAREGCYRYRVERGLEVIR